MSETSEKLLKNQEDVSKKFNDAIGTDPVKAQAYAVLGIYTALNTIARLLCHTSFDEIS